MMLEYFGWKESASLIEHALEQSFLDARATADLARFMPGGVSFVHFCFYPEIVERIEKIVLTIKNDTKMKKEYLVYKLSEDMKEAVRIGYRIILQI